MSFNIVAVVDGGEMYNPFAAMLRQRGMPVFRDADRAVRALGLYVQARLGAENLRCRRGGNVEEKKANPLRCDADS